MPIAAAPQKCDILITNGKIIDGTSNSWYYADVATKNRKIISIGKLNNATTKKTIEELEKKF